MKWEVARKIARTERARMLVEGLDLEAATDVPGSEWEPFQLALLNDDGPMRHDTKSRQVGYSWLIAAEAVANSLLMSGNTSLFVSINREESSEKIRYARQIYEALYPSWRVPLVGDNITALVFSNRSRIISMPQRPVRGKAKAWVYLDEFAHYRLDKDIYTGTVPVTTKGGRLRIGSTTLGARGMFWEVGEQRSRPYPGYTRSVTPWYATSALLTEGVTVREATRTAREGNMTAQEMVERFGNSRVRDIFDNLPLDDFEQEYCCLYIDETASYIVWDDIIANTMSQDTARLRYWLTKSADQAHDALDEMYQYRQSGMMSGRLTWGLDVGRKRDTTELVIMELLGRLHVVRAVLSLDRQNFETQEAIVRKLLDILPVERGYIDQNGLGMQLAETMTSEYGERALPMVFSSPTKAQMAQHLKTRFQQRGGRGILIPNDRDLKYQIHSIRRHVTIGNNVVFDVEHSSRHHADKFWSLALANEAAEGIERSDAVPMQDALALRSVRVVDSRGTVSADPDLGDEYGHGWSAQQLSALIEHGITALLPAGGRGND